MKMNVKNVVQMLFKSLPYVYRGAKFHLIYMSVISLIYSAIWFLIVPVNQYMFDTVFRAVYKEETVINAVFSIVLVLIVLAVQHIFNGLNAYNHMYQYFTVMGYLSRKLNEKIDTISPIEFEDTKSLEAIEKAKKGIENVMWLVNIFVSMLFFYIPQLLFYSVYFYKINPLLVLIVLFLFIPQIIASFLQSKFHIDLENEISSYRRKIENYDNCMTDNKYIKETKMLGAYSYFAKGYKETQKQLNTKRFAIEKKVGIRRLGLTCLTLAGYAGVIFILIRTFMLGKISVGSFSAIFISLTSLIGIMKEIAFGTFSALAANFGSILNFISFMECKSAKKMAPIKLNYSNGIQLHHVSFQYPNTNRKAIDNINLTINANETIAIVGENGAGKSTLARLLLGIYQPQEGKITIGEAENKQGNPLLSHKNTSAIFQNFQKFALTLKENIQIGDKDESDEIEKYIKQVELDINPALFKEGEYTILAPEFGGINLSGGQWQKVAIARGLYRKHDFIILDEPTSAIDPIEEAKVFQIFNEITKEKTAVIITHRLGSVKSADRIIVLDKGKIVEEGTHETLLVKNGTYAYMFREQAKWYERG